MKTSTATLFIVLIVLSGLGCNLVSKIQATAVPPATATFSPVPAATTLAVTSTSPGATATWTPDLTQTAAFDAELKKTQAVMNANSTQTATAGARLTAAAQVNVPATQQAQAMMERIQKLSNDGVVGSTTGDYYRLDDFDESWAQISWYRWWPTDYEAENFVISTNASWDSASTTANWPEAGCGFVFSLKDKNNHHYAYLGLDGYARIARVSNGSGRLLASNRFGKLSIPQGNANLMLVVYNKKINFYVNDQRVSTTSSTSITSAPIALTLLSGTNKDFGTRCQMSDIDLWIFK